MMSNATPPKCPVLKDRFSWYEKLLTRVGLVGLVGVGALGIYLESPAAASGYLAFALVGGLLVVYDCLCVYCPYPYEHSDCLFFPPQLVTGVVKRRTGKIHWLRKVLLLVTAAGLVLIPQYWLWGRWGLLALFWILAALIGVAFAVYYCPRCRHGGCPMNRAAKPGASQANDSPQ